MTSVAALFLFYYVSDPANVSTISNIIVLNGASSSGKTSLAKELQEILEGPYIHLEEDRFVYGTYHPRYLQTGIVEETFANTMLGYYRSLKAFASAGHNVLADTGLYTPELLQTFAREMKGERVWLVGIHCSLEELERREAARGDRQGGLAREQFETIHRGVRYDVEVDTSSVSLRDCAERVREVIEGESRPAALHLIR